MRIFIGWTDIGNIAATYAKAFRALEHETFTVVWSKSRFFSDAQYDVVMYEPSETGAFRKSLGMFARALRLARAARCDLFLMFAPAVLPTQLYYPLLKLFGKKIVTAFWGSDVRYWYAFDQETRALGLGDEFAPFSEYMRTRSGGSYFDKRRTIAIAERYSDLILAQPDSGQLQRRAYMRTHVPLDLALFKCNIPDRAEPLILHAPSVRGAKGTEHILAAIDQLAREGLRFEFRLIENMPNAQLREWLSDADILVDELYALTVGGLSAEAMASGTVTLVRYLPEYSKVPPGCPAVNTSHTNLVEHLREVIVNRDVRRRLAHAGRPYVERHNDHIQVARQILGWLEPGAIREYDFTPTFAQNFVMPPELLARERAETNARRQKFFKLIFTTGATRND